MTVDEIFRKEKISVRSYHVCKYNNLNSVKDLKEYYYKHKSFDKLRNCGRKSNEELIEICNKYQGEYLENREVEIKKENPLKTIISELTRVQREVINSFILVNTNSLSVRSKNAISLHLKGNLKIINFAEKIIFSNNFNVKNIKNIGAKSIDELEIYISIIRDFLIEVSQSHDEKHLISLKNNFLIQRTFSLSKIPNDILETESIFLLTDFLLNQNALFDETQTVIVKKAFKIYQNQKELTLDDIGEEVNLTRERVRQIRKICLDNLFSKLSFIQNFNDDLLQKYNIDINSNQIEIHAELVENINLTNLTYLSQEFITYILFTYLYDAFSLVGNIEDVIQPNYFNARNRHNWNNFYLIKKELVTKIDFHALANDIDSRISDRIEESYTFNFKSYLSRFLTNNNIEILDLAFPIAEKIVNDEFELYLDLDENIIFKRNTVKQVYEYSYEALEQLGKPSKVKDIYEKVIELYPNYDTEEAKIRVSMKRKNGFVPIGRRSVFGLKKWENQFDNFKGGTIRGIVEDFLLKKNEPQHIASIANHVIKYRPNTYERSILDNLKADKSGVFKFFKNSTIGLKRKEYSSKVTNINNSNKKPKSSSNRRARYGLDDLNKFIIENKRIPHSKDPDEQNQYHYYYRNKKNLEAKEPSTPQESQLVELIEKFGSSNGSSRYNIDDLNKFIIKNQRMPRANKTCEINLYQYCHRQKRKLLNSNDNISNDEQKLLELIEKFGSSNRSTKYNVDDLNKFIVENQRIPSPQVTSEIKLYHYYHRQKRKLLNSNDNISNDEQKLLKLISQYKSTSLRVVHDIEEIIKFIKLNLRLPNSKDINESKLYSFYYRTKKNLEAKEPLTLRESQLIELIQKYGRTSRNSKYSLDDLNKFIIENQRMPDSRDPNERNLYQYYYRNKKLYDQYKLSAEETIKFIEVAKLQQNIKHENKRN